MEHSNTTTINAQNGFIKHVFNFDKETKGELLNIAQYSLFAVVPIVLLVTGMEYLFPKTDKTKGNLELLSEALGQMSLTFMLLVFIHRLFTFFATWGEVEYHKINYTTLILSFLLLSVGWQQGKPGKKLNVIAKRVISLPRDNYWDEDKKKKKSSSSSVVKISQPLNVGRLPPAIPTQQLRMPASPQQPSMAGYIATQDKLTQENATPPNASGKDWNENTQGKITTAPQNSQIAASGEVGNYPNFQAMYAGGGGVQEPMAANEAMGGFGGSTF